MGDDKVPHIHLQSRMQTDPIIKLKIIITFFSPLLLLFHSDKILILISEMTRRWCTLEGGFLTVYESERSTAAISRVDVTRVVSLAASNSETVTGAG